MKKLILFILFLMISINYVYALDLSAYPDMFISDNEFDGFIVIGDDASAEDIISTSEIVLSMNSLGIKVGEAKLSSEISDIHAQNIISVGNPCNNQISANLMGNPSDCLEGLKQNEGLIKLTNKNGYYQLLVAGYDNTDTRNAAKVLVNYQDYDFKGTEIRLKEIHENNFELEYLNVPKKDLSDYPYFFVKDNTLDVILVVDDKAPSTDVIAQTQIALSLAPFGNALGISKLVSEVEYEQQNIISIGSPCYNEISAEIMNNPEPCDKELKNKKIFIKMYQHNDNVQIVVMGNTNEATREAANILKNFQDYNLKGNEYSLEVETLIEEEINEEKIKINKSEEKDIEEKKSMEGINIDEIPENIKNRYEQIDSQEKEIKEEDIKTEKGKIQKEENENLNIFQEILNWLKNLFGIK